jgi:hypothetical protein
VVDLLAAEEMTRGEAGVTGADDNRGNALDD